MARYRRKTVEVDAVQVTAALVGGQVPLPEGCTIRASDGAVWVDGGWGDGSVLAFAGDWIVTDWQGLRHVVRPTWFEADYEPVPT